jgi:enoyl-CoA hydratase
VVHASTSDGITRLRMESGKVQALDLELVTDLARALAGVREGGARAVVLTGTGSSFSAGVDLFRVVREGEPYIRRFLPALGRLLGDLLAFPIPLVTAINGHAVAGGGLIAWCGDVRLMAAGAGRIGVPELRVGVPFPAAAVEVLRLASGGRGLQPLAYVGGTMPPHEALGAELLDDVVEPDALEARAVGAAESLASIPRQSFALTKQAIRRPFVAALEGHGAAFDAQVLATWTAAETLDAVRGYLQRTFGRSA